MKIAIMGKGFIDWGGGIDFLRFCMNALKSQDKVEIVLFLPIDTSWTSKVKDVLRPIKYALLDLKDGKIPRYHKNKMIDIDTIINDFRIENPELKVVLYQDDRKSLIRKLDEAKIDVLIPSIESLGKDFPYPWVGYLYDFQHKYYSEFFTENEIERRDKDFETMLMDAKMIIVNALDVKNDINNFFPNNRSTICNLPFAPIPKKEWFQQNLGMLKKYQLPKKYFIISNQFWIHKDHRTAFRALALLNQKGYNDYEIVCSGNPYDYRYPQYFNELKNEIDMLGITGKIKFLGYVPKLDQIAIMRNSIAVIQPTWFEGGPGGGAVYDAVAVGVSAIVSDIDVNKEIDNEYVEFFKVKSPENLAEKMIEHIKIYEGTFNKIKSNADLLKAGEYRLNLVGERLMEAIEVVSRK